MDQITVGCAVLVKSGPRNQYGYADNFYYDMDVDGRIGHVYEFPLSDGAIPVRFADGRHQAIKRRHIYPTKQAIINEFYV